MSQKFQPNMEIHITFVDRKWPSECVLSFSLKGWHEGAKGKGRNLKRHSRIDLLLLQINNKLKLIRNFSKFKLISVFTQS